MEVLTGQFEAPLVPSSMSGGNTVANPDSYKLAKTAPGSPSILPPSPTTDMIVEIPRVSDEKIPVKFAGTHGNAGRAQNPGPDGGGRWSEMDGVPAASRWKQL